MPRYAGIYNGSGYARARDAAGADRKAVACAVTLGKLTRYCQCIGRTSDFAYDQDLFTFEKGRWLRPADAAAKSSERASPRIAPRLQRG